MKTGDLAKQFGIDPKTVTNWTSEFADYLSDGARKIGTHQRIFNADDFAVMATIHELSTDGHSFKEIHQRLADGYRIDDPAMATVGYSDGRQVPAAVIPQIKELAELQVRVAQVEGERDKLVELLDKSDAEKRELQTRVDELQEQIGDLREQLGELRGELNYRRQQDDKSGN